MKQFAPDQLGELALEALAEAARLAGPRTKALSFALTYLYGCSGGPRAPFDAYWKAIRSSNPAAAGEALGKIRKILSPECDP